MPSEGSGEYNVCLTKAQSVRSSFPAPMPVATRRPPQSCYPFISGVFNQSSSNQIPCITFVDPVPNLVNSDGTDLVIDANLLATQGTVVTGIAAEGAARLIILIPAELDGERFTVPLKPDNTENTRNVQHPYGLLDTIPSRAASLQVQVTVSSTNNDKMPFAAFVQYYPPADFSRNGNDDSAPTRIIELSVTSSGNSNYSASAAITLFRPPVVLVHGVWSRPTAWNSFTPLVKGSQQQFFVREADYHKPVNGTISNSVPQYSPMVLQQETTTAALGFEYNAPLVLVDIRRYVDDFRKENHAAAAQTDVVAHNMGGDVTRTLEYLPAFITRSSSAGLETLGFNGPKELDPNSATNVPAAVIELLNSPSSSYCSNSSGHPGFCSGSSFYLLP